MLENGVQGLLTSTDHPMDSGMTLQNGETAALESELLRDLTFKLRRATLGAHEFSQLLPKSHRIKQWSPKVRSAYLAEIPSKTSGAGKEYLKGLRRDVVNVYAIALTLGSLSESEFAILQNGCAR
jgi:hypothetical protein